MDLEKLIQMEEIKWGKLTYKKNANGEHKLYDTKAKEFINLEEKGRIIIEKQAERLSNNV